MVRISSRFAQAVAVIPLVGAGLLSPGTTPNAYAQATPRITGQAENSALVSVPGSVHPWARAQFDRGPAPANLNGRMLMVLKRSPEQESALQALLASQQDPKSPNYHKWLTPEEFGKRFGVADSDVQTITSYLSAKGMNVGRVYGGHMAIEVGATPAQIKSAFQTEIHVYSVAGKTFYANNSNPKIPSALTGVVSGFAAMNNFKAAGGSGAGTQATLDPGTHTLKPLYTTTNSAGTTIYGVSPADLATQYNIPTLTTTPTACTPGGCGANVNVGIIGDSDINVSYINNYRTIFSLGANTPIVVVDGNDPGVNGDAYIAYKQIELVGAVAPKATIYYYTSATTDYDTGMNFALIRAIADDDVQVLLNGFQSCETALGTTGMELVNEATEQAAAQGMTVIAAAGNTGSAACEVPGTAGTATSGYAINGYASSPYLTAVGGTDFFYSTTSPATHYWTTNSGYKSIRNAPIPEQVWNDSYPNYSNSSAGTSLEFAGGGGISNAGDGTSVPQAIPSYQFNNAKAKAISSTSRIIPDVSFFAGSGGNLAEGYNSAAYLFCMNPSDCQTTGTPQFTYSGGTEASSAVVAGAVALAVNKLASGSAYGLGNINPSLYSLLTSAGGATIIAHDVQTGNNELQCTNGTPNCATSGGNFVMSGYAAGVGYDAASGLGSFDINSFVSNYAPLGTKTSTVTLTIVDPSTNKAPVCGATPNCTTHSTYLKFTVTATGSSGTPTGDVVILVSSPLQAEQSVETLTLAGGTASNTWNLLPGGTYNIYARYTGDGTYLPSVGAGNPSTITVKPEACQMVFYPHTNNVKLTGPTSLPYGSPVIVTVEPYSAATTNNVGIPSGSINVKDGSTLITTLPVNSEGAATFKSNLLAQGSHSLTLVYPGDASFTSCQSGPYVANITKAATTTVLNSPEFDTGDSGTTQTLGITAVVTSATLPSNGVAPTGTVTFSTKTPKTVTLIPGYDSNGNSIATASTTVGTNDFPSGGGSITATYTPAITEVNYTGSTSSAVSFLPSLAAINSNTTTTFTITDVNGTTYPTTGTYPLQANGQPQPPPSFPALDSLTLHMHVKATNPNDTVFLVYANGVLLTPATWSGGFINPGSGVAIDSSGNATFTIPQLNGYLALPSGQVQFTVLYDGWITSPTIQSNPSSASQIANIIDDRTSADFSLQSDTTVNQAAPLLAAGAIATYNLRLTSIYNMVSAYGTTPINLSCSVVGFTLGGVRIAVPAGLACGFNNTLTSTTTSVQFSTNNTGFISQSLYVGAASGYTIASNTAPPQPATRWWIAGGGTTLACIFLLGLPARRRKWQSLLGVCVMVIVSFGMSGCGATVAPGPGQQYYSSLNGGSSGGQTNPATVIPPGTYTVLVTATATTNTTLVHTLPVQVLVGTTN
jgi:hypothetical protein